MMLKDPYDTGNSGPYGGYEESGDLSESIAAHVLGKIPKDENITPLGTQCDLCHRTQLVLWKNCDWYGELRPFMYGCMYGLRGGLCTNYCEVSASEAQEILAGARPKTH